MLLSTEIKKLPNYSLQKGANLNEKDGFEKTSLDSSFMSDQNIIADLLRKHGGKTSEKLKAKK